MESLCFDADAPLCVSEGAVIVQYAEAMAVTCPGEDKNRKG